MSHFVLQSKKTVPNLLILSTYANNTVYKQVNNIDPKQNKPITVALICIAEQNSPSSIYFEDLLQSKLNRWL